MPTTQEAKRGGVVKYRTVCPHGKDRGHCKGPYVDVAVVRRPGPRGGQTVSGPAHHKGDTR